MFILTTLCYRNLESNAFHAGKLDFSFNWITMVLVLQLRLFLIQNNLDSKTDLPERLNKTILFNFVVRKIERPKLMSRLTEITKELLKSHFSKFFSLVECFTFSTTENIFKNVVKKIETELFQVANKKRKFKILIFSWPFYVRFIMLWKLDIFSIVGCWSGVGNFYDCSSQ